jgi:acyl-lipid omega-6 desaturase (Delta-12 desaturase)
MIPSVTTSTQPGTNSPGPTSRAAAAQSRPSVAAQPQAGQALPSRRVRRSDFILTPYCRSDDRIAAWQLVNTVVPYLLLWALVMRLLAAGHPWLCAPLLVVMVLFSGRCFSLMHDCGHRSLFRTAWMNRGAGFLLGVINAIPQHPWSEGHAYHHRHNGNWELYRGPSALISVDEFLNLSAGQQRFYQFLRHPLMLFPGGFFYLVIKPRVALLLGSVDALRHAARTWRQNPRTPFNKLLSTHTSKHWYSTSQFVDLLLNNICVISGWVLLSHWLGAGRFWSVYSIVMACSAALFICIFFVQHNFETSYAHRTEGWSGLTGALDGTSLLLLPPILNWFTADIGFHNIHHLCETIPNYRLRACHERNAELLKHAQVLHIRDIPDCFKFVLWDRNRDRLQSVAAALAEALAGAAGPQAPVVEARA